MSILTDKEHGIDTGLVTYTMPRVNLLPNEVFEASKTRRSQVVAGAVVLLALGLIGGLFYYEVQQKKGAENDLTAAQATTKKLEGEKAKYAEVPKVQRQLTDAATAQQTAMQLDVAWYQRINDLSLAFPPDMWFDSMKISLADSNVPKGNPDPLATPGIGTIEVTGYAMNYPSIATWLEALDKSAFDGAQTTGFNGSTFKNIDINSVGNTTVYKYETQATITDEALSHRFDKAGQ